MSINTFWKIIFIMSMLYLANIIVHISYIFIMNTILSAHAVCEHTMLKHALFTLRMAICQHLFAIIPIVSASIETHLRCTIWNKGITTILYYNAAKSRPISVQYPMLCTPLNMSQKLAETILLYIKSSCFHVHHNLSTRLLLPRRWVLQRFRYSRKWSMSRMYLSSRHSGLSRYAMSETDLS